ncbi:MAG: FAD-binding protein, partial [Planctomycetota bacterium]
ARHLISEAVRGEGAHLLDADGRRFMGDYSDAMELAPRDEVSRAITDVMEKSDHPCVYLSLAHLDPALVAKRFPNIGQTCERFGLDISKDQIPVRPGAHYMIGGVTTDQHGATTLSGLWSAGESTSSGLHGANRLASNSLLEGLVFGKRAGEAAAQAATGQGDQFTARTMDSERPDPQEEPLDVDDLRRSLASLMTRRVGIARDASGLRDAGRQVDFWAKFAGTQEFHDPAGWELQNMLLTARLMAAAASARKESRGTHFRSDHPAATPGAGEHVTLKRAAR